LSRGPMRLLEVLKELAKQRAIGPSPSFNEVHLFKAMEMLGKGPIGRHKLSQELRLGEGSARTLIEHLQAAGIVGTSKMGCMLTRKGLALIDELKLKVGSKAKIPKSSLAFSTYNYGILIKKARSRVSHGLEQRDAAVRAGAAGATTLVFKNGRLVVPPVDEAVAGRKVEEIAELLRIFHPEEDDVIVISGSEIEDEAETGAFAAALTLL